MNLLSGLFGKLKNFIFPQAVIQREFDVQPVTGLKMERNINLWYAMYINQPPWAVPPVVPLGIPAAVCRELSRATLSEFSANIAGSIRADYLNEQFQAAQEGFLRALELGLATGGVAFKPYIYGDRILVDGTSAAAFQPTKFDAAGVCVGGVFREKAQVNNRYYVRMEYHNLEGTTYTIQNKAYHSDSGGSIGSPAALNEVPEWASVMPEVTIQNVDRPLFSYFKPPQSNNIDTDDPTGMSIYGGSVVDLIMSADNQWDLIRWEYKSGQRKIFMDATETTAKDFDKRLFEIGPFSRDGQFFQQFEPTFRDDALYRGLQNILKQIEFQVGVAYGTISDPQSVEKTATEIRNSKMRMFITIDSIQKALEHVFDTLIYGMDVYASLYNMAPAGGYDVSYDWGDSILDDADAKAQERANDRQDLASGILNDWEYRAKWYNEDEETARQMLPGMEDMTTEGQGEIE